MPIWIQLSFLSTNLLNMFTVTGMMRYIISLWTCILFLLNGILGVDSVLFWAVSHDTQCDFEGKPKSVANFTNNSLLSIPVNDIPINTTCLYLTHNNIATINNELGKFHQLLLVDISFNKLVNISKHAFDGLDDLKVLLMSDNKLYFAEKNIPQGAFNRLGNLEVLHIENQEGGWNDTYRDDLFSPLLKLRKLHLDGIIDGKDFGPGFLKLKNLTELYIFGDFDIITNATFMSFVRSSVETLAIKSSKLTYIDPKGFTHFLNLSTLDLSDNPNLGFESVTEALLGLIGPQPKNLNLQNIVHHTLKDPPYTLNTSPFFERLNKIQTKSLFLDRNWLIEIAPLNVTLTTVEVLSLGFNILVSKTLLLFDYFAKLKNLRYISGACQMISPFNEVAQFYKLSAPLWNFTLPSTLETINMTQGLSYRSDHIPFGVISNAYSLRYIDFSGNNILHLTGPIVFKHINNSLSVTIDLSKNNALSMSSNLFNQSIANGMKIVTFYLGDNRLGNQLLSDQTLFQPYRDLTYLDLSRNSIKGFQNKTLCNLQSLKHLSLSGNALRNIDFSLDCASNLQYLDLSYNLLSVLKKTVRTELDNLIKYYDTKRNLTVDLTGNPLVCDCQTLHFLNWINETKVTFRERDAYNCFYKNDFISLGIFFQHYQFYLKLKQSCSSKSTLIIVAVTFTVAIVSFLISVVVYHHRWDIRFYCLTLTTKRKKKDSKIQRQYRYDAFVAYHKDDFNWIKDVLLKNLENFRLCLHHRDFIPGVNIEENIIDSIENSYKTILVLTRNFTKSEWCEFELQMARMKCFDEGRDIIIVIMREHVPAAMMSKTLQKLIKHNTYLEWKETYQNQAEFWTKLKRTIQVPVSAPLVCECGRYIPSKTNE